MIMKVEVHVMLIRNMDQIVGLWNETRLIINDFGENVIEVKVLTGICVDRKILLIKITMIRHMLSF